MKSLPATLALYIVVFCLLPALTTNSAVAGDDWKPVDPAHLALKAPPVDQYQIVRSFFEKIRAAEQAPVVLVRK